MADQVPGFAVMQHRVRVGLARVPGGASVLRIARVIVEADRPAFDDRAAELGQEGRRLAGGQRRRRDKGDAAAQVFDLAARFFGEDGLDLAAGRRGGGAVWSVEVLRGRIGAEQQRRALGDADAYRRQEIALDQRITDAGLRDHRHARLTQRLDVAVDRAFAGLESRGEVFGAARAFTLQFEHYGE